MKADELVVERILEGRINYYAADREDRLAAVAHLLDTEGLTLSQVAVRFKARKDTIKLAHAEYIRRTTPRPLMVTPARQRPSQGCTTRRLIEMVGLDW